MSTDLANTHPRIDESEGKDEGKSSEDQLSGLESNPKHILQDASEEKTSKTVS